MYSRLLTDMILSPPTPSFFTIFLQVVTREISPLFLASAATVRCCIIQYIIIGYMNVLYLAQCANVARARTYRSIGSWGMKPGVINPDFMIREFQIDAVT